MDSLGRFYTTNIISDLLITNLVTTQPRKILDLGIGDASLTLAAYNRWSEAKYFATEIEQHKVVELATKLNFLQIFHFDTLLPNIEPQIKEALGAIDVAICNPPYIRVSEIKKYQNLFVEVGCEKFLHMRQITSEIVFFAHNLSLLKENGELGIIISDSLATGKDYQLFRQVLFEKFEVNAIIQLPDRIFNKTEARTHILILSKTRPTRDTCTLYAADYSGGLKNKLLVRKDKLVFRFDHNYYNYCNSNPDFLEFPTLKEIGATIIRGQDTHKALKLQSHPFFHSTNLKGGGREITFKKDNILASLNHSTEKGDILVCRVGKRCVGQTAYVTEGNCLISDCIFRIRVAPQYHQAVWHSVNSKQGKEWFDAYAHGVCARVISKGDLENFPLFAIKR